MIARDACSGATEQPVLRVSSGCSSSGCSGATHTIRISPTLVRRWRLLARWLRHPRATWRTL